MRLSFVRCAVVGLAGVILSACSSDTSGAKIATTPEDGGTTTTEAGGPTTGAGGARTEDGATTSPTGDIAETAAALRPLADAACKWSFKCCSTDEIQFQIGPTGDAGDCADRLMSSAKKGAYYNDGAVGRVYQALRNLDRIGYGADPHVRIDAAAVTACAASLAAEDCATDRAGDHCTPSPSPVTLDDPCDLAKLIVGDQKEGRSCSYGASDCARGLTCVYANGNDGVCVPQATHGDRCLQDSDCTPLLCDFGTGTCITGKGLGEACAYSDPAHPRQGSEKTRCVTGLLCDTVTLKCADPTCAGGSNCSRDGDCPDGLGCVKNQCGKPLGPGEDCYQATDCASGTCKYDNVIGRQRCLAPGPIGARCDADEDCAKGYCKYDAGSGTCTAQAALGAPCPSAQGSECSSGRCLLDVSSVYTCAPAAKVGDTCASDQDCNQAKMLYCIELSCALVPALNGEPCANASQCKSGTCTAGKCVPKGVAGDPCGGASPPCDLGFYCADGGDGGDGGTSVCRNKKPQGASCGIDVECWGSCQPNHGVLRCNGAGNGPAFCDGR